MRAAAFLTTLGLIACGSSGTQPHSGDGTITITTPANSAMVTATTANPDVDIAFTVASFTLKDPGKCGTLANCGHVHMTVDGTTCNDPKAAGPYNNDGSASPISVGLDYCPMISGTHQVTAELHNDDHSTYTDPAGTPVVNSITITVP